MRIEGGEDGIAQALMSGCDQSAAQRSVACMHDAGTINARSSLYS